jgi:CheY-like chemotaxis protein
MKVFVLEDDENRLSVFHREIPRIFPNCEYYFSISASGAKAILAQHKVFDLICLDHDLGGQIFVNSSMENTGYQVAKFIRQNGIKSRFLICHSLNPVGTENIVNVFPGCFRVPFPTLMSYLRLLAQELKNE